MVIYQMMNGSIVFDDESMAVRDVWFIQLMPLPYLFSGEVRLEKQNNHLSSLFVVVLFCCPDLLVACINGYTVFLFVCFLFGFLIVLSGMN